MPRRRPTNAAWVFLLVGWVLATCNFSAGQAWPWSTATRTERSRGTRQSSRVQPFSPLTPYALCLSGQARTFTETAPMYRVFLEANKLVGVDVFGFLGWDTAQPWEAQLESARSVTVGWPGRVRFVAAAADPWPVVSAALLEGTVTEAAAARFSGKPSSCGGIVRNGALQAHYLRRSFEMMDAHVQAARFGLLGEGGVLCPNLFMSALGPPCFVFLLLRRGGVPYNIVVRSRFDVLFPPQPLELSAVAAFVVARYPHLKKEAQATGTNTSTEPAATSTRTTRTVASLSPPRRPRPLRRLARSHTTRPDRHVRRRRLQQEQGQEHAGGSWEGLVAAMLRGDASQAAWRREEGGGRVVRGALFVPFCCDWYGLNDQVAIGTYEAMAAYSSRIFEYESMVQAVSDMSSASRQADTCSMTGGSEFSPETANWRVLAHQDLAIHRFWFQCKSLFLLELSPA